MFGFTSSGAETMMKMLLDVSMKATLLAVAVWAMLALFHVRSVTIRHRVWSLVLFSMVLLPAMIRMAPVVVVPAWWSANSVAATVPDRPADLPAEVIPSNLSVIDRLQGSPAEQESATDVSASDADAIAANETALPVVVAAATVPAETSGELNATTPVRSNPFLLAVAVIYVMGVTLLMTRIIMGMIQCVRLIHQSRPVVLPQSLPLPATSARIVESNQVPVPLTLGLWHPVIVLPTDWKTWDGSLLETAIAHEAEHVRRRDTWVVLLTTFNTALYWFHPLSWLLRRHITELAEQACDDEVIRSTGQRTAYAQILVEMATRLATGSRRYQPAGIGMAKTPFVEVRINRILDSNRPLAGRLSMMLSAVLISIMAAAAMITAGLSSAPAVEASQEVKVVRTGAQPAVADPVSGNLKTNPRAIEGRVVMADNSPYASESAKDKTIRRWLSLRPFDIQVSDIRRLDSGSKVRTVLFRGPRISDSDLARLAEFPEIEGIGFYNTSIDGSGFQHLTALPKLKELAFFGARCTDAVLGAIPELPQVRSLTLMECGTSDRALTILARFPQINTLHLRFVRADLGLENLRHVPLLTHLYLDDTHLTDSGLQHLALVPQLKRLSLDGPTDISDDGLSVLQHLPELESFFCTGLVVHGEGLKSLAAATNLKELSFAGPGVNDEWLRAVTSLQNVEWLQCNRTEITGSGLKWIENWSKVKKAYLNSNRIDDAGVEHLAKLYRLEDLDVINNRLSDVGIKSLREALPDTFIQHRESPGAK